GEPHAALFAGRRFLELAFAAAAGVDLRFHHEQRARELLHSLVGLARREGDHAVRCRDAELAQELLCLVLVDVHAALLLGYWRSAWRRCEVRRRAAGRSWCRRRRDPSPTRPT